MTRLSNYEILRSFSMLLVLFHSFGSLSPWPFEAKDQSLEKCFIGILSSGGKVGINLYMMITGYFLAGRTVQASSVIRTWLRTLTYSWAIFSYMLVTRFNDMRSHDYYESLFPVLCYSYWLITLHLITVMLSPVLSKLATSLSHQEYLGMLTVMFVTMSIFAYFYTYAFSPVFWFMFLFLLGSYLRLYRHAYETISTPSLFAMLSALIIFNIATIYHFSTKQYTWLEGYGGPYMLMTHDYSPLAVIIAIFTFLALGRLEFRNTIIDQMAGVSLGVYLVAENRFLRWVIWPHYVNGPAHIDKPNFYVYCLLAPCVVFVACGIIEFIRRRVVGDLESKLADKIEKAIIPVKEYLANRLDYLENDEEALKGV